MNTVGAVLNLLFGCRHRQLSRVFTIDRRTYRVCCKCGVKFDYSLENMSMRSSWLQTAKVEKTRDYPNVVGAR